LAVIDVREVHVPTGLGCFLEAARRAQACNPRWVEPLHQEYRWAFDPRRSPLVTESEVRTFVAFRDAVPVGRIATIVNPSFLERHGCRTGHFGLVEGIDDSRVFAGLLDAAAATLREAGLQRMQGPYSLSINHEAGLLVEGFDQPHTVRTNHVPPYYARHMESAGCHKVMDLLAACCSVDQATFCAEVAAIAAKSAFASKITTLGLSVTSWWSSFPRVLTLYNDAWRQNWGSVPVTEAEARMIARLIFPISKPGWVRIAEWEGEPIAIVAQIPDVNEALAGLHGKLLPFGFAALMWRLHVRGTKRTRIPMIGVASKWQGTRVGALAVSLLLAEAIEQARKGGVEEIEISWMLETNRAVLNLVERLNARITRRFRIYERSI
jgi:GNAT superfamily N-acetyltransferase